MWIIIARSRLDGGEGDSSTVGADREREHVPLERAEAGLDRGQVGKSSDVDEPPVEGRPHDHRCAEIEAKPLGHRHVSPGNSAAPERGSITRSRPPDRQV